MERKSIIKNSMEKIEKDKSLFWIIEDYKQNIGRIKNDVKQDLAFFKVASKLFVSGGIIYTLIVALGIILGNPFNIFKLLPCLMFFGTGALVSSSNSMHKYTISKLEEVERRITKKQEELEAAMKAEKDFMERLEAENNKNNTNTVNDNNNNISRKSRIEELEDLRGKFVPENPEIVNESTDSYQNSLVKQQK